MARRLGIRELGFLAWLVVWWSCLEYVGGLELESVDVVWDGVVLWMNMRLGWMDMCVLKVLDVTTVVG